MSTEVEQERIRKLCERIVAHCHQRHWCGPDAGQMWRNSSRAAEERFLFPPATEAQAQAAETALAFPLPSVLRAVYTQVANGGFGPGYGLVGVSSGAPAPELWDDGYWLDDDQAVDVTSLWNVDEDGVPYPWIEADEVEDVIARPEDPTLAATLTHVRWRLSQHASRVLEQEPGLQMECEEYPDGFVTLCHWGCGIYSRLDGWTGRVYGCGVGQSSDWQADGDPPWVYCLEHQAVSVEEWFEKWLGGELRQPFTAHFKGWEEREREMEWLTRPTYLDYLDEE